MSVVILYVKKFYVKGTTSHNMNVGSEFDVWWNIEGYQRTVNAPTNTTKRPKAH